MMISFCQRMQFGSLLGLLLVSRIAGDVVSLKFTPYTAHITPISGSNSTVSGTITVVATSEGPLFYGGFIRGLAANLLDADCTATNGCGVHVHSGKGCEDSDAQGGHFYSETLEADPWSAERYTSDEEGKAAVGAFLEIGSNDLSGRAVVGRSFWGVYQIALNIVK
jgi:hypothetical protein